jgi:hypothetical protein
MPDIGEGQWWVLGASTVDFADAASNHNASTQNGEWVATVHGCDPFSV